MGCRRYILPETFRQRRRWIKGISEAVTAPLIPRINTPSNPMKRKAKRSNLFHSDVRALSEAYQAVNEIEARRRKVLTRWKERIMPGH
jgi:hypothetical protein